MADLEFVNPGTGAALGTHAYGTVAAGSTSASFAARLRYKWGQSGSGLNSNALVLEVSTDGGTTWRTDLYEFTIAVTAVQNVPVDPLFTGTTMSARRTTRLELPALRAGCAYDLAVVFAPTLRTGAATTAYSWRLGVSYNEAWRTIGLVPDAPSGILPGVGDATLNEWVTAPTLANGTDKVTLGAGSAVVKGSYVLIAAGDVALSQNDVNSDALASGEEYIAVGAVYTDGSIVVMKGVKATAGTAVAPTSYTDFPCFSARVPYGGVIATSTLLAVAGRCLVADAGGLTVTVQPGRAVSPGLLACPATVQTLTMPDDATSYVYLSETGVAGWLDVDTEPIRLATVVTSGGDISTVTDTRRLLRGTPIRLVHRGNETTATGLDWAYLPFAWTCDRAFLSCGTAAAGASGYTDCAVKIGGNPIATRGLGAGSTSSEMAIEYPKGTAGRMTFDISGITTGGTRAADFEAVVWITEV